MLCVKRKRLNIQDLGKNIFTINTYPVIIKYFAYLYDC